MIEEFDLVDTNTSRSVSGHGARHIIQSSITLYPTSFSGLTQPGPSLSSKSDSALKTPGPSYTQEDHLPLAEPFRLLHGNHNGWLGCPPLPKNPYYVRRPAAPRYLGSSALSSRPNRHSSRDGLEGQAKGSREPLSGKTS